MALQQKLRVLIEIGPDSGSGIAPFQQPAAFAAAATAALRALTMENFYPDAEFVGTKDGVTAILRVNAHNLEMAQIWPAVFRAELEGTVMLESPDLSGH
jgi:hypothetical protein